MAQLRHIVVNREKEPGPLAKAVKPVLVGLGAIVAFGLLIMLSNLTGPVTNGILNAPLP